MTFAIVKQLAKQAILKCNHRNKKKEIFKCRLQGINDIRKITSLVVQEKMAVQGVFEIMEKVNRRYLKPNIKIMRNYKTISTSYGKFTLRFYKPEVAHLLFTISGFSHLSKLHTCKLH